MAVKRNTNKSEVLEPVTNDGAFAIEHAIPYRVEVTISGAADMLFHRWSCDAVEAQAKAAKGSSAKREDNIESYVYRCEDGTIGLPGEYLRQSIIMAAKYKQDPRSPRKSAQDLFKAGVVSLTELASLGTTEWDYISRKRVQVQRNGITRARPAFLAGWEATIMLQVLIPEYIGLALLRAVLDDAGRLVGVADFRPTYGRFTVSRFEALRGG